jgi:hypothetical protein
MKLIGLSVSIVLLWSQIPIAPAAYAKSAEVSSEPISKEPLRETFYVNREEGTFALFSEKGDTQVPVYMGKRVRLEGRDQYVALQKIVDTGRYYVLTNPQDESFLQVIERLPEGGFGRLLRHTGRSSDGSRIDLEFVYEDRMDRMTILDYVARQFYEITFDGEKELPPSFKPVNVFKSGRGILSVPVSGHKLRPSGRSSHLDVLNTLSRLPAVAERVNAEERWQARQLRGPPAEVLA